MVPKHDPYDLVVVAYRSGEFVVVVVKIGYFLYLSPVVESAYNDRKEAQEATWPPM
jgi:hypothetical protein